MNVARRVHGSASATEEGVVELATTAETTTGTDATRAVTPDGLQDGYQGSANVVTTGALNSGSITTGFGNIDNGSSTITTTGDITGGGIHVTGDTAAGDSAALGYTATEGLIITGQGSTNDVTVKNDADAAVISIPTGTTTVTFAGAVTATSGTVTLGTIAGTIDAGGATSLEIPNGAAPTVNAAGEIAVDTTITDHTGAIKFHDGTEELTVISLPTANLTSTDGHAVKYNATNNEFEMGAVASAGATAETSVWVDAGAMVPEDGAAGPTAYVAAGVTSGADIDVLLFAELETSYFKWTPPPQYDGGEVTAEIFWAPTTGASAADKVKWGVAALSIANDEDWDGTAFPAPDEAEDSVTADDDLHTIEITGIATSWNDGEAIIFELERTAAAPTKMAEDARLWGVRIKYNNTALTQVIGIAASDETTDLVAHASNALATIVMPFAFELTEVMCSVTTAPVTGTPALTADIELNGTSIMTTHKLDILTTATVDDNTATLTTTTLAKDDKLEFLCTAVGSGTAGAGLKFWLIGYQL